VAEHANNAESRLDNALDPARLERDRAAAEASRQLPWQRAGVVAEDERGALGPRGPFKLWMLVLFASLAVLPLVAVALLLRTRQSIAASLAGPLALFAVVLGMMVWTNWFLIRARRTGEAYAPSWCWGVLAAGVAAIAVLALAGWLPIGNAGFFLMLPLGFSSGLVFPMRKREGFDLRCAACDYPYTYTDPDAPPAPEVCSECGAPWHARRGLARGAKVRPHPARVGVYLLILAAMFSMILFRKPAMRVMPTGTLIAMVTAPRAGFVNDEWAELATRSLSDRQRGRLARGLLDLRLAEQSLAPEADAWLDAEALAGRLPADIVERYHREMFDATLLIPATAEPWAVVEVGLDAVQRGYPSGPRDVLLAVEGFERLDRPGEWVGRQDRLIHGNLSGLRNVWLGSATGSDYAPRAEFVFEEPGRYRVRCVYWVVVVPRGVQPSPAVWGEDGPSVPAGVLFVERREVVGEVEVLEIPRVRDFAP
jgi:hypothetical protein